MIRITINIDDTEFATVEDREALDYRSCVELFKQASMGVGFQPETVRDYFCETN